MATTAKQHMVRVNERTHQALSDLSNECGESMSAILDRIVQRHRREQRLEEANRAWARVLADPTARAEVEAEDALWDGTFADGLEPEEW